MRIRDLNWMPLEEYLARDDRILLPVGSTEQRRAGSVTDRVWEAAVQLIRKRLEEWGATP